MVGRVRPPADCRHSRSLKTLARWVLFIAPLQRVLLLRSDKGGPLAGCLLCVSGDGTIAVIALENYSL
jgi:WD repeat-containing protein 7